MFKKFIAWLRALNGPKWPTAEECKATEKGLDRQGYLATGEWNAMSAKPPFRTLGSCPPITSQNHKLNPTPIPSPKVKAGNGMHMRDLLRKRKNPFNELIDRVDAIEAALKKRKK